MEISERLKDGSAVVCVVGVGYVGLPLAEAFSNHLKVIGYDLNEMKVKELNHKNNNNNLIFTSDPARIRKADFILIAVPTRYRIQGTGPVLCKIINGNGGPES